jgi:hypothetical protein
MRNVGRVKRGVEAESWGVETMVLVAMMMKFLVPSWSVLLWIEDRQVPGP